MLLCHVWLYPLTALKIELASKLRRQHRRFIVALNRFNHILTIINGVQVILRQHDVMRTLLVLIRCALQVRRRLHVRRR